MLALNNFLVPASGTTHGYPVSKVLSATPLVIDFRVVELDGEPFVPSGVYIDNSAGIGDLVITIAGVNYSVVCPAGARVQAQYPAPADQSVSITGNGLASITFVDYPVIPFVQLANATLGNVTIANGGSVALGNTADAADTDPAGPSTVIALLKGLLTKEGLGAYPFGAVPFRASAFGVNVLTTATVVAVPAKTHYVSKIVIGGQSPTAATILDATLSGVLTAPYVVRFGSGTGLPSAPFIDIDFNPPIPANAVNTAVSLSVAAFGAGSGIQTADIFGYTL